MNMGRFKVLEKRELVASGGRRNTVVSNQRLGEDNNLTSVGRISHRFRISNQRGGKDSFTRDIGVGAKRFSVKNWAITNGQSSTVKRR